MTGTGCPPFPLKVSMLIETVICRQKSLTFAEIELQRSNQKVDKGICIAFFMS